MIQALRARLGSGGAASRAAPPPAAEDSTLAIDHDTRLRWKAACQALGLVLSRHPSARSVFRQLAQLETALLDHGPRVIHKLPLELLERALSQFETLVTDWSAQDLAYLRSQLSVSVSARQRAERSAAQELSVLVTPERLQVREGGDSVFMEFQRHFNAVDSADERRLRSAA